MLENLDIGTIIIILICILGIILLISNCKKKCTMIEHFAVGPQQQSTQNVPQLPTQYVPQLPTQNVSSWDTRANIDKPIDQPIDQMVCHPDCCNFSTVKYDGLYSDQLKQAIAADAISNDKSMRSDYRCTNGEYGVGCPCIIKQNTK